MIKIYKLFNIKKNVEEKIEEKDIIHSLYYLTHRLPKLSNNNLTEIKQEISRISNLCPLYDIYTDNLYLISQDNLYNSVFNKYYRFPTIKLLNNLKIQYNYNKKLLKNSNEMTDTYKKLLERTNSKYKLILTFMNNFDNNILLDTYIKSLYNTKELGKSITLCKKPSFLPNFKYIKPYFTKDEIINTSLNNNLIQQAKIETLTNNNIRELCNNIKENDINYINLINHHNYIVNKKAIGLVQYYSIQGSFIINEYLRNDNIDGYNFYNEIINSLNNLIINAPKFNKDYILYRFVNDDMFLNSMEVGDIYTEKGYMSTTRNPFYKQTIKNNTFGWILLKIKMPKEISALCIETLSFFPLEQEIIFHPGTQMKLISKNKKYLYHHTDKKIQNKIKKKYEFEIINNIDFIQKKETYNDIPLVSFLNISNNIYNYTNKDNIIKLINNYSNKFNQFYTKIDKINFLITVEEYNSTENYKKLYAITTNNGFCLYCIYKNHQIFNIEIGENEMFVNYNIKYSSIELHNIINPSKFLRFIAEVSYYFSVDTVIIYTDYISCDYLFKNEKNKIPKISGVFCYDIYNYIKNNTKKYKNKYISPAFDYKLLDLLKEINVSDILSKTNKDNTYNTIYYIYNKIYKLDHIENDIASFYIWLVENNCYYLDDLLNDLSKIPRYINKNPFINDFYIFNAKDYLISKKIITNFNENIYENNNKNKYINKAFDRIININDNVQKYNRKNNLLI